MLATFYYLAFVICEALYFGLHFIILKNKQVGRTPVCEAADVVIVVKSYFVGFAQHSNTAIVLNMIQHYARCNIADEYDSLCISCHVSLIDPARGWDGRTIGMN